MLCQMIGSSSSNNDVMNPLVKEMTAKMLGFWYDTKRPYLCTRGVSIPEIILFFRLPNSIEKMIPIGA